MIHQSDAEIAKFILDGLSGEVLNACRLMASVKYPLEDRKTLVEQLDGLKKDSDKQVSKVAEKSARLIIDSLTPSDFPIMNLQNGLEKLYVKLPPRLAFPDLFIPDIRGTLEVPGRDVLGEYISQLGSECGQRAFKLFADLIRDGFAEPVAYYAGLREGQRGKARSRYSYRYNLADYTQVYQNLCGSDRVLQSVEDVVDLALEEWKGQV